MRNYPGLALVIAGFALAVANSHAEEKRLESVVVIGKAPPAFATDLGRVGGCVKPGRTGL